MKIKIAFCERDADKYSLHVCISQVYSQDIVIKIIMLLEIAAKGRKILR